ncbi:hypothetical protein V6N13_043822 [Hibiscus sabdariffa]
MTIGFFRRGSENLFPVKVVQEEKDSISKKSKSKSLVEQGEKKKPWLDGKVNDGGTEKRQGSCASGLGGHLID